MSCQDGGSMLLRCCASYVLSAPGNVVRPHTEAAGRPVRVAKVQNIVESVLMRSVVRQQRALTMP